MFNNSIKKKFGESNYEEKLGGNSSESDEEKIKIRSELKEMSFEDLIKLKEEMGAKVYNEAMFGITNKIPKRNSNSNFKRDNKNRPREMSTKRPVSLLSLPGAANKSNNELRDPRFDSKCGEYNTKKFKQNFNFIPELREQELVELEKLLLETKEPQEKFRIKTLIQRLRNQNLEDKKYRERETLLNDEKKEIQKAKSESRQPQYKTNSERKTIALVRQYEELKSTGKLDKHLEKRRKKNAQRDRKKLN